MDRIAGFLRRGLGYLADACLGLIIFQLVLSSLFLSELVGDLSAFLPKSIGAELTSRLLHIAILIFVITQIRFVFTLILGESFGQFLMGIHAAGGHFWKRVGGAARVQLELFLTPFFFIADFPVIFRRRGLKEFLTLTALRSSGQLRFFLSFFIFLPLLILLATVSPLMRDYRFFMGITIERSKEAPEELSAKSDFSKFTTYRSPSFHMLTLSSLNSGRFLLIPSFSVEKRNGENIHLPLIQIYDTLHHQFLSLSKYKDLDLFALLSLGRNYNPLFFARYPELAIALAKDPTIYNRRGHRSEYGNRGLLDPVILPQIKQLLESSIGVGLNQLYDYIMDQGPFIKGAIDLRTSLMDQLEFDQLMRVELIKLGDQNHFVFSSSDVDNEGKPIRQDYLVGIETFHPSVLLLKGEKDSDSSMDDFKREFFSAASWFYDYTDVFSPPLRYEDIDPLLALDYLGDARIRADKRKLVEDFLYHHFFDLCKRAVVQKDSALSQVLVTALNRHTIVSNQLWEKSLVGRDYVSFIQALKVSLKNNDRRYFGLK